MIGIGQSVPSASAHVLDDAVVVGLGQEALERVEAAVHQQFEVADLARRQVPRRQVAGLDASASGRSRRRRKAPGSGRGWTGTCRIGPLRGLDMRGLAGRISRGRTSAGSRRNSSATGRNAAKQGGYAAAAALRTTGKRAVWPGSAEFLLRRRGPTNVLPQPRDQAAASCSARNFSASSAAMQPMPALVTAWR